MSIPCIRFLVFIPLEQLRNKVSELQLVIETESGLLEVKESVVRIHFINPDYSIQIPVCALYEALQDYFNGNKVTKAASISS